jgi:hypothetical protein
MKYKASRHTLTSIDFLWERECAGDKILAMQLDRLVDKVQNLAPWHIPMLKLVHYEDGAPPAPGTKIRPRRKQRTNCSII